MTDLQPDPDARHRVEIEPNGLGGWTLLVDGHDLSIVTTTASVVFERIGGTLVPVVTVELMPLDRFAADLPDAVLRIIEDARYAEASR